FDLAEGDAYNRSLINRAERRLKNLSYFKTVRITSEPGSAPDRVIVNVDVEEQSTGEFSVSGGYSTADGFLGEVSVAERNRLGRGLYERFGDQSGRFRRGGPWPSLVLYFLGIGWRGASTCSTSNSCRRAMSRTRPTRSASARGSALRCARI